MHFFKQRKVWVLASLLGLVLFSGFLIIHFSRKISKIQSKNQKAISSIQEQINEGNTRIEGLEKITEIQQLLISGKFAEALIQIEIGDFSTDTKEAWIQYINAEQLYHSRNYDSLFYISAKTIAQNESKIEELKRAAEEMEFMSRLDEENKEILVSRLDSLEAVNEHFRKKAENAGVFVKMKTAKGYKLYYFGEVLNGLPHGKGVGVYESLSTYEGEWQNGLRHGQGKHQWKDGETYNGAYENDKRNGYGTYVFQTGDKFSGNWKDDLRHGEGTLYDSKGNKRLAGVWKNDRYQRDLSKNGQANDTLSDAAIIQ